MLQISILSCFVGIYVWIYVENWQGGKDLGIGAVCFLVSPCNDG